MLTVIEEESKEHETIEMDEYVPFSVEFGVSEMSPSLYWRGGDGKLSLVEFGMKKTGAICGITLTSINSENVIQTDQPLTGNLPETNGLPVFDTTNWPTNSNNFADNFQDEFTLKVKLIIGSDYLSLIFEKSGEPIRYIRNEQVRFGVTSHGLLSNVDIVELTHDQISTVKSAVM